jgi:hypothetical protein
MLSLLNRAHDGKEDILKAFKTYYETAEFEAVTDPNLVYDLRAKLDATGYYDDFEVDRVAAVEVPRHFLGVRLAVRTMSWISSSDTLSISI